MTRRVALRTVPWVSATYHPDPAAVAPRWRTATGIGFAVLTLYALVGPPWPPHGEAPAETWHAHMADATNRLERSRRLSPPSSADQSGPRPGLLCGAPRDGC